MDIFQNVCERVLERLVGNPWAPQRLHPVIHTRYNMSAALLANRRRRVNETVKLSPDVSVCRERGPKTV